MIQPAATVILLKPRPEDGQPLVYLTQRHATMRFLANYIVFPGGNVDTADADPAWANQVHGRTAAEAAAAFDLPAAEALSFWIAAIRELCEEAGVLLTAPAETTARLRAVWQKALAAGTDDFLGLVTKTGCRLALDQLHYMDRRIGPPGARLRYDTRYFLALLPDDQEPIPCPREVSASFWMTPAEAVDAWERQELLMVPPTVATLRTLAPFASIEDMFATAAAPTGLKMQSFPPFF